MKKLFIVLLMGASLLGITGCGNTNKEKGVETTQASTISTQEEKDSVNAVAEEAVPTKNSGEYSISGAVKQFDKNELVIETERGTQVVLPAKDIKAKLSEGDNVLVTMKMDILKAEGFDDITIVNITKL